MMELPHLGQHCAMSTCKQLDFLPVKCDACDNLFCKDHMLYVQHDCTAAYKKDVQVPVCPLCNRPVPVKRGELPDIMVGQHIDTDCQSDPAKQKRKIYTNKCSRRGCKQKEMINISCTDCRKSFCLKHRHPQDHDCGFAHSGTNNNNNNMNMKSISRAGAAAMSRIEVSTKRTNVLSSPINNRIPSSSNSNIMTIQGNMSEDEAFARALQLSLSDQAQVPTSSSTRKAMEDADRQLAEALAASEASSAHKTTGQRDKCTLS